MAKFRKKCAALVVSLIISVLVKSGEGHSQDLELTFHRETTFHGNEDPCGILNCRVKGHSVTLESVTVYEVKVKGEGRPLLTLTSTKPDDGVSTSNIRGNGTIQINTNRANIDLYLLELSVCKKSFFTCEMMYVKSSGEQESQFATAGPGQLSSFLSSHSEHSPTNHGENNQCLVRDQINEVRFDSVDKRLNQQDERFEGMDTRFETRFLSLENRFFSVVLAQSPSTTPNPAKTDDLESRLSRIEESKENLETRLSRIEESKETAHPGYQAEVCERGMGDDVTKWYPPYVIMTHSMIGKQIQCDTHTDGGGWIVIQKRTKGDVDFYRDWSAYREGFGSVIGDFWLGNRAIHGLTDEHPYELRIYFRIDGQEKFAHYSSFRIENEADKYRLRLGVYSGTVGEIAGTGLSYSNNKAFSTFDRDNDGSSNNCAIEHHGAWWYHTCHGCNLNGKWGENATSGVSWKTGEAWLHPTATEMKIRRVKAPTIG